MPSLPETSLHEKLRGVLVPFPTPFDADDELDMRAVRANIERWNETGVSGYVALGSTGERVHLDEGERVRLIEAARACIPAELAFIVGVGEQSTRGTIRDAARAARAGADAVLVMTPHFYRAKMTHAALVAHFTAVADSSPVPVVLYNIPQNTGVAIAPETVARLAGHENVFGLKDSSGDVATLMQTLRLVGGVHERFIIMTGHAGVLYPTLCAGVGGAILAAACVLPELCVEIFDAVAAGRYERARVLQERLAPVADAVTAQHGIGGLKAALDLRGYHGGMVRAPLEATDERAREEIARLLAEATGGQGETKEAGDAHERLVGAQKAS